MSYAKGVNYPNLGDPAVRDEARSVLYLQVPKTNKTVNIISRDIEPNFTIEIEFRDRAEAEALCEHITKLLKIAREGKP
jgi:hypothetical protein